MLRIGLLGNEHGNEGKRMPPPFAVMGCMHAHVNLELEQGYLNIRKVNVNIASTSLLVVFSFLVSMQLKQTGCG